MYDAKGEKTWEANLDIYGKVRTFAGRSLSDCPFRYQGQYQDKETGLYYNRFRYYDPDIGNYLSQDPIGLMSEEFNLYSYVRDVNNWIDPFGLTAELYKLTATKDGYYDLKEYGKPTVKGGTYLKAGETYKIGETTQFNKVGKQKRYSEVWLQKNNLEYVRLQNSPNRSAKKSFQKLETAKIDKHTKRFGKKPTGNSCRH
jgi:RHS repeat-associated protein